MKWGDRPGCHPEIASETLAPLSAFGPDLLGGTSLSRLGTALRFAEKKNARGIRGRFKSATNSESRLGFRGRRSRGCLFLFVVGQRLLQRDATDNHAVAFLDVGVFHRHVRTESRPFNGSAFRINHRGALGVVILDRSRACFRPEGDVIRARRVGRDRTGPVERRSARARRGRDPAACGRGCGRGFLCESCAKRDRASSSGR